MPPSPRLTFDELVLGLDTLPGYFAIGVFADDLEPTAFDEMARLADDGPDGFELDIDSAHGVVHLSRTAVAWPGLAAAPTETTIAAELARAAVADRADKGGCCSPVLGLLLGDFLSDKPESPRRVFPLVFDVNARTWSAYDGGLLRWMKQRLCPSGPAVSA